MKKIAITFVFIFLSLISFSQLSLYDSLLFYYNLDSNVIDYSSNNHDGTIFGAIPAQDRYGNPSSAMWFDGVDDYVLLPNSPKIEPQMPVTVAFWVYIDQFPTNTAEPIFLNDFLDDYYYGFWVSVLPSQQIGMAFGDGGIVGSSSRRSKISAYTFSINTWYHILAIFRGTTDMDMYINCILDNGTYSGTGGSLTYSIHPGVIAKGDANSTQPPTFFHGRIDEIGFWSRELSSNEKESICNTNLLGVEEEEVVKGSFKIFPNPTNGFVNLEFANQKSIPQTIEVYSIDGKLLKKRVFDQNINIQIDCSDLSGGTYIIRCSNEEMVMTERLIKL